MGLDNVNVIKFDICLMNPPFSGDRPGDGLYTQFFNKVVDITDKTMFVGPSTAFVEHQSGSTAKKHFKETRSKMDAYNTVIEKIDNDFAGVAVKSELVVVYLDKTKSHKITYIKNGITAHFEQQKDIITFFDNEYMVEFDKKLKLFISKSDVLEKHIKLTKGYGGFSKSKLKELNPDMKKLFVYMLKPNANFVSVAYKNKLANVRNYNEDDQKIAAAYVCFNIDERYKADNFIKYINTDFVKICVKDAMYSSTGNVNRYQIIPYLDFSKTYDDNTLFKMIGMTYDKNEVDNIIDNL